MNAAWRHHECLLSAGMDSCVFTRGAEEFPGIRYVYSGEKNFFFRVGNRIRYEVLERTRRVVLQRRAEHALAESFSDGRVHDGASVARQIPSCDIAHVHLLDGFIGYKHFFRVLPRNVPVVWTLHDNMPLTGGCQFNFGCDHYQSGCGNCPQLQHSGPRDGSWRIYKYKQGFFDRVPADQITFVSASQEQCEIARSSPMTSRFEVLHVPLSLDTRRFSPGDKVAAKQSLGVSLEKLAVGFAASSLGRPNKGFALLAEAIRSTPELQDRIVLVLVGMYQRGGEVNADFASLGCEKIPLDWVSSEDDLIQAYRAMDVLVAPSYQESCGQTVMEALSCGVPVLGSDIGGIRDQIREGENGHLFPRGEAAAIARLLMRFVDSPYELAHLGVHARKGVERFASYEVIGRRFCEIYIEAQSRMSLCGSESRRSCGN